MPPESTTWKETVLSRIKYFRMLYIYVTSENILFNYVDQTLSFDQQSERNILNDGTVLNTRSFDRTTALGRNLLK